MSQATGNLAAAWTTVLAEIAQLEADNAAIGKINDEQYDKITALTQANATAIADLADTKKAVTDAEIENARLAARVKELEAAAAPPVVVPPVIPPVVTPPTGDKWTMLAAPLTGSVSDLRVDAINVKRVWSPSRGKYTLRNVKSRNVKLSFIEWEGDGLDLTLESVAPGITVRYGLYVGAKAGGAIVYDKIVNVVTAKNCYFDSSTGETPVRAIGGVRYTAYSTQHRDNLDIGANKNEQAARLHCLEVHCELCAFDWLQVGPQATDTTPKSARTNSAVFIDCDFFKGIRLTKGVLSMKIIGKTKRCKVDLSGNPFNIDGGGPVDDTGTDLYCENVDFIGNSPRLNGKFVGCTLNGKPWAGN